MNGLPKMASRFKARYRSSQLQLGKGQVPIIEFIQRAHGLDGRQGAEIDLDLAERVYTRHPFHRLPAV